VVDFYAMIGSAAAALTGLMFVVITLVTEAGQERVRRAPDGFRRSARRRSCISPRPY